MMPGLPFVPLDFLGDGADEHLVQLLTGAPAFLVRVAQLVQKQ